MLEIGIVGGGPGGLAAARQFHKKCLGRVRVTVLEASARLGGKLVTGRFPKSGIAYPAGVAEIYDYRALGPDPLADLVESLGLTSRPIAGRAVVMGENILGDMDAVERVYGAETRRQIDAFHRLCAGLISPAQYYEGRGDSAAERKLARTNALDFLHEHVRDDAARRYLRAAMHSDVAAALHLTNALNAVRNVLMDVDGYIELRSIDGGVARLTDAMAAALKRDGAASFEMETRVRKIGRMKNGRYHVTAHTPAGIVRREFDLIVVALPLSALSQVEWEGAALDAAMARHIRHFDRPGHYVRASVLFEKPFWRDSIKDDWWISDAFDGCCVYDESARSDCGGAGMLGWLIAGNGALALANLDDDAIVARALDSLPLELKHGAALKREAAVHRWLASVNAVPGGLSDRGIHANHVPEPARHPGLFLVGDYAFDSTINAVIDSADAASDLAFDTIVRRQPQFRKPAKRSGPAFYDDYRGIGPYGQVWDRFLDARTIKKLAQAAFGLGDEFSILEAGAASGLGVAALRAENLDAWGVEPEATIHARTPHNIAAFNKLGDVCELPYADGQFDVVYETCLAQVPDAKLEDALAELRRVARRGVFFGSVTGELALSLAGRYALLDGVPRLRSAWEWSEWFRDAGFAMAVNDDAKLAAMWRTVQDAGFGPGVWFDDSDSLRHCFYAAA
jgi:monoamine oxidase/SAM-dependent methyltransferase